MHGCLLNLRVVQHLKLVWYGIWLDIPWTRVFAVMLESFLFNVFLDFGMLKMNSVIGISERLDLNFKVISRY